jgi:hypothetical protein
MEFMKEFNVDNQVKFLYQCRGENLIDLEEISDI